MIPQHNYVSQMNSNGMNYETIRRNCKSIMEHCLMAFYRYMWNDCRHAELKKKHKQKADESVWFA